MGKTTNPLQQTVEGSVASVWSARHGQHRGDETILPPIRRMYRMTSWGETAPDGKDDTHKEVARLRRERT